MAQVARNLTDAVDGFLRGKKFLVVDRDTKFTEAFRKTLAGREYAFHFAGWGRTSGAPTATASPLVYKGTTFAFWEMREAAP